MRLALLFAVLVVVAGVLARRRIRAIRYPANQVTDEMIRQIEQRGRIEHEIPEPPDLEEIRDEEDQFWEQTWDEPEEL